MKKVSLDLSTRENNEIIWYFQNKALSLHQNFEIMTIREVLTTRPRRANAIVRNNGQERMSYSQIQFTSDCIRRYAINKGKRLDDAFAELQKAGGMDVIAALYAENPVQSAGIAARKLERKIAK